eukprot:363761-Chlamydomonas_euryale.AAC.11
MQLSPLATDAPATAPVSVVGVLKKPAESRRVRAPQLAEAAGERHSARRSGSHRRGLPPSRVVPAAAAAQAGTARSPPAMPTRREGGSRARRPHSARVRPRRRARPRGFDLRPRRVSTAVGCSMRRRGKQGGLTEAADRGDLAACSDGCSVPRFFLSC